MTEKAKSTVSRSELQRVWGVSASAAGMEREILRVAQEAIHNVKKHAAARHLSVRLEYGPAEIALEVRDDGRGFAASDDAGADARALWLHRDAGTGGSDWRNAGSDERAGYGHYRYGCMRHNRARGRERRSKRGTGNDSRDGGGGSPRCAAGIGGAAECGRRDRGGGRGRGWRRSDCTISQASAQHYADRSAAAAHGRGGRDSARAHGDAAGAIHCADDL